MIRTFARTALTTLVLAGFAALLPPVSGATAQPTWCHDPQARVASVPVIVPLGTHWQGSDLHVTGMTTTEGVYLDNNGGLALVCVKGDGTAQWDTCATCPIILA